MKTLSIFFILCILVIYLQYDLLKPVLDIGFTPDDWAFVFLYKMLGPHPLSKIIDVWVERGAYTTIPVYYTGIIHFFTGFNFQAVQIISITFKTLATLTIFPLVLVIFKSKMLAFLTTILFAMSYPTTGALETVVEPTEYLGMLFMNIFLIAYYYVLNKNFRGWKWLILITFLLILTIMSSIMRLYPLLILIPLIEVYLWMQNPKVKILKFHLFRLIVLFSPFLLIFLYRPTSAIGLIGFPPSTILKLIEGNWHLALTPFQGIGHIIPLHAYWGKIFGSLSIGTIKEYLNFLLNGPTIIFSSIILLLSFFKLKNRLKFFLAIFFINLLLGILIFYIATHNLVVLPSLRLNFDLSRIYPTLTGLFMMVLAFFYWLEWQIQNRKDKLLLALWVGPYIAFLFVILTWILADISLGFGGAQDHYLLIPTFGISLFLAGLLMIIYKKMIRVKKIRLKVPLIVLIFSTIFSFYYFNRQMIYSYFNNAIANGRSGLEQQMIQSKFRQKLKGINYNNLKPAALFYFDTSDIPGDGRFWTETFLSSLPFWMHFHGNQVVDGCVEVFYESKEKLAQLIKIENGEKGFVYRSLCVENGRGGYKQLLHTADNFYAFKLKNRDFIDVKEEVLNELGFKY